MEILNVETRWIENRCYRLTPGLTISNAPVVDKKSLKPVLDTFIEDEPDYDPDLPIMHSGNTFYITIHCPTPLKWCIVGRKGRIMSAIAQTGATVNVIDLQPKESIEITVSAQSKTIVSITYHKIQELLISQRLADEFTHFISLPMNSPEICSAFEQFKEAVLSKYIGVRGINESIFQTPSQLHVTIVPLVLYDKRDKEQAKAILNECIDSVMKDFEIKEFTVDVTGIEYMNDDPSEVKVLYAKIKEPEGDSRLQLTADRIMKNFIDAKLGKDQYEKVKLHITLMNTTFRNKERKSDGNTFDARPILKDFENFHFGKITISEFHMSVRHTISKDGYYIATCKKKLK